MSRVMLQKIEVYKDAAEEWRWRAISINGVDVVATSGEGYVNHTDCLAMAAGLFPEVPVSDEIRSQPQPSQPA